MSVKLNKLLRKAIEAFEAGRLREADKLFKKVLRGDPDCVDALYLRGTMLAQQGDFKAALASLKQAVALHPNSPFIHNNLGGIYQKLGAWQAAVASYKKALVFDPDMVEAHAALGSLYQKDGAFEDAERHYLHALKISPNAAYIHFALGEFYRNARRLDAAEDYFQRAVSLAPSSIKYHVTLAVLLAQRGKLDEAELCLANAKNIDADSLELLAGVVDVKARRGEYQAACDAFSCLAEKGQATIASTLIHARALKELGRADEGLAVCEKLLRDSDGEKRSRICFVMGELADSLRDYSLAFRYFEEANKLKDEVFDEDAHCKLIQEIKSIYRADNQPGLISSDSPEVQPIFIVGMPRSGTSLVEQILASHPDVYGAGERNEISQFVFELLNEHDGLGCLVKDNGGLSKSLINELQQRYLGAVLGDDVNAPFFTDKMPLNYLYLGFIGQLFPNAKILHCRRNPLDTCLSCYFSDFHGELAFTNDLYQLGKYYRGYHELMAFWNADLELPMLDVEYEALIDDQRAVTEEILRFCGLSWDDRCMRYFETDRYVNTLSCDQVRKPLYTSSVGRHQNYKESMADLEKALGELAADMSHIACSGIS
jgi:tetratricopeptide (TPR) repeat protein